MTQPPPPARRTPLSRDRVLRAAVALADRTGIDALSMRKLAQELGVVPMALYKHVANKDQLLDGMVDFVLGEIGPPAPGPDWQSAVRARILAARSALLGHTWAATVVRSRTAPTPALLAYTDSLIGLFRTGGFSVDLTHHAMHALGSRLLGFTQELFDDSPAPPRPTPPSCGRWRRTTRTSPSWQWPRPTTRNPSWAPVVTTNSSSSSPWTCSSTASNASAAAAGPPSARPSLSGHVGSAGGVGVRASAVPRREPDAAHRRPTRSRRRPSCPMPGKEGACPGVGRPA
ncbi:TetR/AcrR family transcriptional regulator [Kitasatospora gansuensis]